ncbi:TPA: hypothetical protein N0F65_010729 [Lagenidium giganteum]|uniref:RNase H type-1 domain-containing protein n=1 Tax=Lagenidium giganteum TaxID=4803 RepID=A0AAV2YI43_9STRA|nr:TPA: hypothetical protein N0F65_010729 [Lagenidium giganteum]
MQEHEGLLCPAHFVSKVFKDAELNYTRSEKEACYAPITVYARHSTLKWLFTCKSLTGRTIQWAAMLSPWNLTIIRKENATEALAGLLAASVTPMEEFDAVLEDISPREASGGFVVSFDGAARERARDGAFAAVVWKVLGWSVQAAWFGYAEGLTVNDSEYQGLLLGLKMVVEAQLANVVVCGDSRIIIGTKSVGVTLPFAVT